MTYLDRFRNKVAVDIQSAASIGDIIAQSVSSTTINHLRIHDDIPVILIPNDKEGADEFIVYSYTLNDVRIADYLVHDEQKILIYEKIKHLKSDGYIDAYKAVQCNESFVFGAATIDACFRGFVRTTKKDTDLANDFGKTSEEKTMIIIPSSFSLGINDNFLIGGRQWKVTEYDDITLRGISYVTIAPTLNTITTVTPTSPQPIADGLISGSTYEFETELGYINTNVKADIIERTQTKVKLLIPFGITSIVISTKISGVITPKTYIIRG